MLGQFAIFHKHTVCTVTAQIFHALGVPADQFTCVNILEDESLRSGLKEYSQVRHFCLAW